MSKQFMEGKEDDSMDVDEADDARSPVLDERFTKHRGSIAQSMSSTSDDGEIKRRPSFASVFTSSESVMR